MKSDFLLAITQLSAEKNLPKDVVLTAVESALASAYKKEDFTANQNIAVKINPNFNIQFINFIKKGIAKINMTLKQLRKKLWDVFHLFLKIANRYENIIAYAKKQLWAV